MLPSESITPPGEIAAIVLAAGFSTRMGQTKALVPLAGQPLLSWIIRSLTPCCKFVFVVTGHDAESVFAACKKLNVTAVFNPSFSLGMLSSIQAGAKAALDTDVQGALIAPVDVPLCDSAVPQKLIDRWVMTQCSVAIPTYESRGGHPVWFDRHELGRLVALDPVGNTARNIVDSARHLERVNVDTSDILFNLNTPHDVERWAERHL
ncbi:MAG: nucleotidyltransferase family protein [Myxococcales bacterium]|nr:nucleotidyltransferase family protein [Myxococcales bacterium]